MSSPSVGHQDDTPLFPRPERCEQALRIAVRRLDPVAAERFTRDFQDTWQEAAQTDSTVPMHMFLYRWAMFVELRRYPLRAARLRELEDRVGQAPTVEEARAAGSEIAWLLNEASAELGPIRAVGPHGEA